MSKRMMLTGLLALSASLAGCFDETIEITVMADGSGAVTRTVYLRPQQSVTGKRIMDKKALAEAAKILGQGVTFKSVKEIKHKDGRKGCVTTYSVRDISKLALNVLMAPSESGSDSLPIWPTSQPAARPAVGPRADKPKNTVWKPVLRFVKGPPARLTVVLSQSKKQPDKKAEPPKPKPKPKPQPAKPAKAEGDPGIEAGLGLAGILHSNRRFCARVKVGGRITKTNATHVSKDKTTVTLFRIDVTGLLADVEYVKKLAKEGERIKTDEQALAIIKDSPYIQVEPAEKVEIEFRPPSR